MRKVVLTMYEDYQYQKVKNCVDQNGNFKRLFVSFIVHKEPADAKWPDINSMGKLFSVIRTISINLPLLFPNHSAPNSSDLQY
jgi:hypothetical protein